MSPPSVIPSPATPKSSGLGPSQDVLKRSVARRPLLPDGPAAVPIVTQPNRTVPTSSTGFRQKTLLPVLPRKGPLVTDTKSSVLSK
jgi:hypothetical protein